MILHRDSQLKGCLSQSELCSPAMQRKVLGDVFTADGGISNRFGQTHVYIGCPYIKVNIRFKAANDENDALKEDPDDIIESVSQPFLQWSTKD
jgi:hypothetical protein